MCGAQFEWYQLRTTDVAAAVEFYAAVLGLHARATPSGATLCVEGEPIGEISVLPERARLRGAPSHWLGHIGVENVEEVAASLTARGAERLPAPPQNEGTSLAILRDPFGAVVALRSKSSDATRPRSVLLHQHIARDVDAAWSLYSGLMGWHAVAAPFTLETEPSRSFAWDAAGQAIGVMQSNANAPQVHAQWQYYFAVSDIERALASVLALGGMTLAGAQPLRTGARFAVCEDAQRAAFALIEPAA